MRWPVGQWPPIKGLWPVDHRVIGLLFTTFNQKTTEWVINMTWLWQIENLLLTTLHVWITDNGHAWRPCDTRMTSCWCNKMVAEKWVVHILLCHPRLLLTIKLTFNQGIVSTISLEIAFWLVDYRRGWILIGYSGITVIIFSRQSVFRGRFSD